MALGMARSQRGFAGTVEILQRRVGRRAGWGRRGRARSGDVGRGVDPPADAPVAPPDRLDVAAGGRPAARGPPRPRRRRPELHGDQHANRSGSRRRPSSGQATCRPTHLSPRLTGCAVVTTSRPAAVPGRMEASGSTTSAGRPPDPPGAAAAEAGAPRPRPSRGAALESAPVTGGLVESATLTTPGRVRS